MGAKNDSADARAAQVAARQHGVVTRRQLEAAGLGSRAMTIRVRKGQLHRIHRGVYAVGHRALGPHGRWMAAVLACGDGAVLSHGSAAALWGLLRPFDGPIHVSIASTTGRAKQRGIHLHRCASLAEPPVSPTSRAIRGGRDGWRAGGSGGPAAVRGRLVTYRSRIPVTTVQRTVEDLEDTVPPRLVRRARRQAELMGIHLEGAEGKRSRSDLEEAFLALCARHRLPVPEHNVKLGRWEVDFLWRAQDLVVEVDSFAYHRGSVTFQDDRARDLDLRQRGFVVLRFSERQLEAEPSRVAADVARALGARCAAARRPTRCKRARR
jgi:very-short-patch-repair endonuclease